MKKYIYIDNGQRGKFLLKVNEKMYRKILVNRTKRAWINFLSYFN